MEQEAARQQANPYAAPKAVVDDVGQEAAQYELAGRRQRLGAAFVDSMIFLLLGLLASAVGGNVAVALAVLGMIAAVVVNLLLLNKNGQTIGKYSFDIKIVRTGGEPVGLGRVVFLRGLPQWIIGAIPFLNMLTLVDVLFIFRADRRCVHDLIADTTVISAR